MTVVEHWFALSTRIKGLQKAGELYSRFQSYLQQDMYKAGPYLREQCGVAVNLLEEFVRDFRASLPEKATFAIDNFLESKLASVARTDSTQEHGARAALVALTALEAEITFLLSGKEEFIKTRAERALLHLNRSLIVDKNLKSAWTEALENGEVACERLGSVHLLTHGIYAFKIDTSGARTDLMFGDPPEYAMISRAVEGLILTEWKVANNSNEGKKKFAEARKQTDLYTEGALAGIELRGYRYLIVVSMVELSPENLPEDIITSAVTYRHINIVVNPRLPSRAARSANIKSTDGV